MELIVPVPGGEVWGGHRWRRDAAGVHPRGLVSLGLVAADAIAARIPGCRRVVVPGADHLLPLRVPGRLAEIILGQDAEPAK